MPGRSIAIDRALHAYGTPFFIAADLPIANEKNGIKFRRLMVGQDTGSAIVGPARADIYFGAGEEAGSMAGRIKNPGQFVMLMPRELDPVVAGQNVRLPPERRGVVAQLGAGNMIDPTAEEVPLPEPRPATAPAAAAPTPSAESQSCRVENLARAMSRRRSLSDEERALWTGVARSIKPLHPSRRAAEISDPPPPRSVPPNFRQVRRQVDRSPAQAELSRPQVTARPRTARDKKPPPLAPLERKLKQRVARGREPIDARLDLHGFTQTQAHAALLRFLRRAQADGVRIALVVTGKGTRKGGRDARARRAQAPSAALALAAAVSPLVVGFEDAHLATGRRRIVCALATRAADGE